jgi:hypothetical protein
MRISPRIRTFLGLTLPDRLLLCEASLWLGIARLATLIVPFSRIAPWLSRAPETAESDAALLASVRRAVTITARHVPWKSVCLQQAIAAKILLARRGCGSSLHLGAAFDSEAKLTAHAWLVAGGVVVVGAAGVEDVKPLVQFGRGLVN